jgi:cytidylate kinase/H/ACA ribonucleoprotein complex subunit 4
MAKKHKMTLEAFGQYCETHAEIDQHLDQYQLSILRKGNIIVEGRLSGWLAYQNHIPALKVLLDACVDIRTSRIMKREPGDFEERKKEILIREKSEATRYKKYYDIDVSDTSIYDIIIDTSEKTPEQIVEIIIKHLHK